MAVQNSIITNTSALAALRSLKTINRNLEGTQNRISTGLKISDALENASSFPIVQDFGGELKAFDAVL